MEVSMSNCCTWGASRQGFHHPPALPYSWNFKGDPDNILLYLSRSNKPPLLSIFPLNKTSMERNGIQACSFGSRKSWERKTGKFLANTLEVLTAANIPCEPSLTLPVSLPTLFRQVGGKARIPSSIGITRGWGWKYMTWWLLCVNRLSQTYQWCHKFFFWESVVCEGRGVLRCMQAA